MTNPISSCEEWGHPCFVSQAVKSILVLSKSQLPGSCPFLIFFVPSQEAFPAIIPLIKLFWAVEWTEMRLAEMFLQKSEQKSNPPTMRPRMKYYNVSPFVEIQWWGESRNFKLTKAKTNLESYEFILRSYEVKEKIQWRSWCNNYS